MYECDICCAHIKMRPGVYNNMKRHYNKKHPFIYAKETKKIKLDFQRGDKNEDGLRTNKKKASQKYTHVVEKQGRPWIEQYMTKLEDGVYQCAICRAALKMPKGLFSNMKRHFARKHPVLYKKRASTYNGNKKECLSVDRKSSDEKVCGDHSTENIQPSECGNKKQQSYVYIIEEHFVGKEHAVDLNKDVDDTNLELTHIEKGIENEIVVGPNEQLQMSDPNIETKIKILCQKGPKGKRRSYKTCFWNFFKHLDENIYVCLICFQTMRIYPESVSNLTRHLKGKHKDAFELILKYIPEYDSSNIHSHRNDSDTDKRESSEIQKSDLGVLEDGFKCIICNNTLTVAADKHMKEFHPNQIVLHRDNSLFVGEQINEVTITTENVPET